MNNGIIRTLTAGGIGIIATIMLCLPPIMLSCLFALICGLILFFEWPLLCIKNHLLWLITPLYPVLPFILLIYLNHASGGRFLLTILFIVTWSFDTGSYICGSLWGKTSIKRTISPGKTWEGALGGACIASIVYVLFCMATHNLLYGIRTLYMPIILCIFGLMGDLFESLLKRKAHIKDSGHLLPGHGGLLDRFDGILFGIFFITIWYFCR